MTVTADIAPFAATRHLLTSAGLHPLSAGEAADFGRYCAGIDPYRRLGQSEEGLTAYLTRDDPALYRFAIESNGVTVGVLAIRSPWLRGPFLEMLALRDAARGRGIAAEAVDWVATEAGRIAGNLWTTVSDFNTRARAFYRRTGFEPVSTLPGLITPDAGEILLRRRLPRPAITPADEDAA